MNRPTDHTANAPAPARLRRVLALSRAALVAEAAARAFWPAATLLALAGAMLLSGLLAALPGRWGLALAGMLALAFATALAWGARRFRLPGPDAARARLDASLPGQPLATLADRPAIGANDPAARAVWAAHQAQMARRLRHLRPVTPAPHLARHDPYGLRLMALTALAAAALFGAARTTPPAGLLPRPPAAATVTASWEGWIEPPAYTGLPSQYLPDQPPGPLIVPQGARITLRFYGQLGRYRLTEGVSDQPAMPEAAPDHSFTVSRDGPLAIDGPDGARWQVLALPDLPPTITVTEPARRTLAGDLELPFAASDDYGVTRARARITLDLPAIDRRHGLTPPPEPRPPLSLDLPLPPRGTTTEVAETLTANLARHPWAGLPVVLSLTATDATGQQGHAAPLHLTLPGRRFLDPLARALIEQRRDLLWNRANAARVARLLRAVSNRPEGFFDREVTWLMLRLLARRLEAAARFGLPDDLRDDIARGLWDIAVSIEERNLDSARERLDRARERLSEAMRQGASPEELSELMDEFREALRDLTRQLAQNATPGDGADQPDTSAEAQELTQQDLEAMMDAIEQALREGRQAEAQAMLQQLQDMMNNMQTAETRPGQGSGAPGNQALQGLADSLNRQQELSDQAFGALQEQQAPGGAPKGDNPDSPGTADGNDSTGDPTGDLARRQQQLADELADRKNRLPGAGSEAGEAARRALDGAERAMRDAARDLAQGDLPGALDRQADAMEALREGLRQLDRALAENRTGPTAPGDGAPAQAGDPLGRGTGPRGGLAGDSPLQTGPEARRRAQELMQELRRRAGETTRPAPERDYLKRLLDQFQE